MWTIEQITYLAGIIDGEGTIYISTRKDKTGCIDYFPRLQIANTHEGLMNWIKNTFGGLLYIKNRIKHNINWRTQYEWYTTRKIMDEIIPLILPFLIVKRTQAELMIEFRKTFKPRTSHRVPVDIIKIRKEYFHKMQSLNKRGNH